MQISDNRSTQYLKGFSFDAVKRKYRAFVMFSVITNIYNKKTKGPT